MDQPVDGRLDEPLRNVGHLVGCAAEARPDPHPTTAVQVDTEKVLTIVMIMNTALKTVQKLSLIHI